MIQSVIPLHISKTSNSFLTSHSKNTSPKTSLLKNMTIQIKFLENNHSSILNS